MLLPPPNEAPVYLKTPQSKHFVTHRPTGLLLSIFALVGLGALSQTDAQTVDASSGVSTSPEPLRVRQPAASQTEKRAATPQPLAKFANNLDALFAQAAARLKAVVYSDFGAGRSPFFGATKVSPKPAVDYFRDIGSTEIANHLASFSNLEIEPPALTPQSVTAWKRASKQLGHALPELPAGMVYRVSDDHQLWVVAEGVRVPWLVVATAVVGFFLMFRLYFVNARNLGTGWQQLFQPNRDELGEISPYQAFAISLFSSGGPTSFAATATAVGIGGLGAAFWLCVVMVVLTCVTFAESTLGLVYRRESMRGILIGGPMRYLSSGLRGRQLLGMPLGPLGRLLAFCSAVLCVAGSLVAGAALAVGQSFVVIHSTAGSTLFDDQPWLFGVLSAAFVAFLMIGGRSAIGQYCGRALPLVWSVYGLVSGCIIWTGRHHIPDLFEAIQRDAFSVSSLSIGSLTGVLVASCQALIFSQSGAGTSGIIHSAVRNDQPIAQGSVAMLGTLLGSTLCIVMTTCVIGLSGILQSASSQKFIEDPQGIELFWMALQGSLPVWAVQVMATALFLALIATCLAWSYCGERCVVYLLGSEAANLFRVVFLFFIVMGAVLELEHLAELSGLLLIAMSIPNLLGIILLQDVLVDELLAYWNRRR